MSFPFFFPANLTVKFTKQYKFSQLDYLL